MMNVAIVDANSVVVAINVQYDDYELQDNEVEVIGAAYVGGDYVDGHFYPEQPYPSWTRSAGEWVPPVPRPTALGNWVWNEEAGEWQD